MTQGHFSSGGHQSRIVTARVNTHHAGTETPIERGNAAAMAKLAHGQTAIGAAGCDRLLPKLDGAGGGRGESRITTARMYGTHVARAVLRDVEDIGVVLGGEMSVGLSARKSFRLWARACATESGLCVVTCTWSHAHGSSRFGRKPGRGDGGDGGGGGGTHIIDEQQLPGRGGAAAPTEPSAVDFARLSGVHVQVLGQVVYVADDPVGSYHCTQKNGG